MLVKAKVKIDHQRVQVLVDPAAVDPETWIVESGLRLVDVEADGPGVLSIIHSLSVGEYRDTVFDADGRLVLP